MEHYVTISEMAKLHGITRQTLIYYDNIGVFSPVKIDENGYRYYSKHQIPYLREICFLRSMDISLKEIMQHFQDRTPEKEKELLEKQKKYIVQKIAKLNKIRTYLTDKINLYREVEDARSMEFNIPFERYIEPRRVLFAPYKQPITKVNLHMTLMELWNELNKYQLIPSGGFGSIIPLNGYKELKGAGSCIFLPYNNELDDSTVMLPGGLHICMYKYGMPYDTDEITDILQWMEENGYEANGNAVDVCLLDTTFYEKGKERDFCMLQIPVKKL